MIAARALLLAAGLWACAASSHAAPASLRLCDSASTLTATQQDRLLQFADIVRRELEGSGQHVALIARSGLDLTRFGVRYSHSGLSLRASDNTPWSVRQLYYACDERRPRLFDQGLAGFLFGTDDPALGYVSILLLPPDAAAEVERTALDKAEALRLMASTYSANAYPFSLRYQNCNQWVIELLATAWGARAPPRPPRCGARPAESVPDGPRQPELLFRALVPGPGPPEREEKHGGRPGVCLSTDDSSQAASPLPAEDQRARAQAWLLDQGYAPSPIEVGSHLLMFAGGFIPWIKFDDHPEEDRFALRFRISMPASIEDFVRQRLPGTRRIELCHDERQVVIRHGWQPLAEGCQPEAGDQVVVLD